VFVRPTALRIRSVLLAVPVLLALVLFAACGGSSKASSTATVGNTTAATSAAATGSTGSTQSGSTTSGSLPQSFAGVVKEAKPAIVQVTNQQVQVGQFNQQLTVPAGVGSGVIYDNQGHIITNNHVVAGASGLLVSLPDGRSFKANLIGTDPQTDLAVLQIHGDNLPVAKLGDSSKLSPGDWTIAIGNALALPGGPTVTVGVVSALGRTVQEPGEQQGESGPFLFSVIQTDAAINPGNSGGALTDANGNVIGINTLVVTQAEPGVAAQNIGFAIAINTVKPIADQLVANGKVAHAFLGVSYVPLTPALAAQLGTTEKQGIIVTQVAQGSPADQAGLQQRDIVTKVDGKALDTESALAEDLNAHKPGDKVSLTVVRDAKTQDLSVTLGTAPTPTP
jgi:S1-C subfamily serine protease